jgi:hypothetical protein
LRKCISLNPNKQKEDSKKLEILCLQVVTAPTNNLQLLMVINKENIASFYRLPDYQLNFTVNLKLPKNYLILSIRSKSMLLFNDGLDKNPLQLYKILDSGLEVVRSYGKSHRMKGKPYAVCFRELSGILLILNKTKDKNSFLYILHLQSNRILR